jgi:hypothetical protein
VVELKARCERKMGRLVERELKGGLSGGERGLLGEFRGENRGKSWKDR